MISYKKTLCYYLIGSDFCFLVENKMMVHLTIDGILAPKKCFMYLMWKKRYLQVCKYDRIYNLQLKRIFEKN
jgi:hypothetical protein